MEILIYKLGSFVIRFNNYIKIITNNANLTLGVRSLNQL